MENERIRQPLAFNTLTEFIDHLKLKTAIIGILQYGNRDYSDMQPGGDFDLIVITDPEFVTSVSGLHFHVGGIPVDCGIINAKDLEERFPPSDFHCVISGAKVLFDRHGDLEKRLKIISSEWQLRPKAMTEGAIAFERFIRKHIIDKFEHRLCEDELYTRLFLSGNVFFLLETYMRVEQLNPYDYKGALAFMKAHAPKKYAYFQAIEDTHDLEEKFSSTKKLNELILQDLGGSWQADEIIFHYADHEISYNRAEKRRTIELIF